MIDAPAQSEVPSAASTSSDSQPDRFAILNEAEKRVHDLLDSDAADKLMKQAEAVSSSTNNAPVETVEPVPQVEKVVVSSQPEPQVGATADQEKIAQAQRLLEEAAELQKAKQQEGAPAEAPMIEPPVESNDSAAQLSESFTTREAARAEVPVVETTLETQRPDLSERETEALTAEVTAFEQNVSKDDGVLKVSDIEHASRTLSPLSRILTIEQDRREVGIRAAIAAHRESLKAA